MNQTLLRKLIEQNIVRPQTEIDVFYRGIDVSGNESVPVQGTFIIMAIRDLGEEGFEFVGASVIDGTRRRIRSRNILKIDGMDPVRLAYVHGITETGGKVVEGKRRGRKPKALLAALSDNKKEAEV